MMINAGLKICIGDESRKLYIIDSDTLENII